VALQYDRGARINRFRTGSAKLVPKQPASYQISQLRTELAEVMKVFYSSPRRWALVFILLLVMLILALTVGLP